MRDLILVVHVSLDGFVAGPRGEFDNFIDDEENFEFVCSLTDDADAALFGRLSYELINSDWPTAAKRPNATRSVIKYSNWYNSVPKYVLSNTLAPIVTKNTFIINKNISAQIDQIKKQDHAGNKNILMFGSPTAVNSLLELNLLDAIWLIIHPVIFGEGIKLFKASQKLTRLHLSATKQLSNGMICLFYRINK